MGEPDVCVREVQQQKRKPHTGRSQYAVNRSSEETSSRSVSKALPRKGRRNMAPIFVYGLSEELFLVSAESSLDSVVNL